MTDMVSVPGCSRTTAQILLDADGVQILKVTVAVGGEIPLHSHDCAAVMFVTAGSATAIGAGDRAVERGDVIVKRRQELHGFINIMDTFSFISVSNDGGIVRNDTWDIQYH